MHCGRQIAAPTDLYFGGGIHYGMDKVICRRTGACSRRIIPSSLPTANPPPNRCPSPLSLRDISPHRGESPFIREAEKLEFVGSDAHIAPLLRFYIPVGADSIRPL